MNKAFLLRYQHFFRTYIIILTVFFKYISKSLAQLMAILRGTGLNYMNSISLMDANYMRNRDIYLL